MTNEPLRIVKASSVPLEEYTEAFMAGFAEYYLPLKMDVESLARKVRFEQCDLHYSLIAYEGDRRAGVAVLAIRGYEGWVGGLGVVPELRGRGVGRLLMEALLESARAARLRRLSLEVLLQNVAARRLYAAVGMRVVREMLVLERGAVEDAGPPAREGCALEEAPCSELLSHFVRLHHVAPAWQRDLPTLLVGRARGLRLGPRERPRAYVLVSAPLDGYTYLTDLAAAAADAARELSAGLACVEGALRVINEPEQSLFIAPLIEHGFAESFRQHEMAIEL